MRKFSKHKHRNDVNTDAKVLPDINVGSDNVKEEKVYFGTSGIDKVPEFIEPLLKLKEDGTALSETISSDGLNRIKFFDSFFSKSKDNERNLARIRLESPGLYTIVAFEPTDDLKSEDQEIDESADSIADATFSRYLKIFEDEDWGKGLLDYLRFLYTNGVRDVQYINRIVEAEMEALLKCLLANKKLSTVISSLRNVVGLADENGNVLYWKPGELTSGFNIDFLACAVEEYKKIFNDASNIPDMAYAYSFFLKNPMPKMKSLKLSEASSTFNAFPSKR